MVLHYCNIIVEIREISLKNRPRELYTISPKGTVPVLQLSSNSIIDESLDIMLWANKEYKKDLLTNKVEFQKKIIKMNDLKIKFWLDRFKYHDRYPEESKKHYRKKCKKYLDELDERLKNNLFLTGEEMQLVDIAIFPFIRQFAHIDKDDFINDFENLDKFLNYFINSDLFLKSMIKYPLWIESSNKTFNIT